MKKIKLRAWHKKSKEMYYVGKKAGKCNNHFLKKNGEWYIYIYHKEAGIMNTLVSDVNGVLMQSTGIKDTKGKDIFEGDIVEISTARKNPWVVTWMQRACTFNFKHETGSSMNLLKTCSKLYKVVGNIYEGLK